MHAADARPPFPAPMTTQSYDWRAPSAPGARGRAAEDLIFGKITNGAASDITTATNLAHKMVCEWGMSDKLGPLSFGKKDEQIFLGREIAQHRDYSEQTAQEIDGEDAAAVARHICEAGLSVSGYCRSTYLLAPDRFTPEDAEKACFAFLSSFFPDFQNIYA